MARFDLSQYQTVAQRLQEWWSAHPDGRVATEIVESSGSAWTVSAAVYRHLDDPHPAATGMAHGDPAGSKGAQQTNPLEDAETSAIGRALANAGFAPDGARPSREEMQIAQSRAEQPAADVASEEAIAELGALLFELDSERRSKAEEWIRGRGGLDSLSASDAETLLGRLRAVVEERRGDAEDAAQHPTAGEW